MPLERTSKGFKDLSMTFQVNPLNNDLIALKNANAIARSVRNLVMTQPGERFFNQDLGTDVSQVLFENMDNASAMIIKNQIENTIRNYEPRVELINTIITPDYDQNEFNVTIQYKIIGIDIPSQQLSFVLQPTR